jgi:hypothetical protein
MLTALPVGYPGLTILVRVEGQRINQDRLTVVELDIVSTAVFQSHSIFDRSFLDFESSKRGIL